MESSKNTFWTRIRKMDKTGHTLLVSLVVILLLPFGMGIIGGSSSPTTLPPNRTYHKSFVSGYYFQTGSDGKTLVLYGGASLYVKYKIVNGNRLIASDSGNQVAKIAIKKGKFRIYDCGSSYIMYKIGGTWYID